VLKLAVEWQRSGLVAKQKKPLTTTVSFKFNGLLFNADYLENSPAIHSPRRQSHHHYSHRSHE
jgi:hypothetical protein